METKRSAAESHVPEHTALTEDKPMTTKILLAALGVSWVLSGCGSSDGEALSPAPPAEVAAACGHPGAVVELKRVPLVVPHDQCDLTGVVVRHGGVGVTVPASGSAGVNADGLKGGASLVASVATGSKDVTIHA